MKKIRPLTLLTKLASLVKLTGRDMGRDLSNDNSLSGCQKEFVSGCGPYRPDEPHVNRPYKQVEAKDSDITTAILFADSRISKNSRKLLGEQRLRTKKINLNTCNIVLGGLGATKPPRAQATSTEIPPKQKKAGTQG
ncbi:hypothetical protein CWB99_23765 [Pseudoalteromonas rubra]|uniref:Uncharacterized protein n=1 Tax=Pseudoalteromonas rubra TaxID=43658 RepID=A0A5S3WFV8_9GAMM|nr:hypothetical protein [Pseudoalteromonas rubra]TMP22878.1 hypothetical protein CWB99_23765 [Pseudoalteromonas rubra]TMP27477.1 hypothetical protein CWC00_23330 [Pseudoalteromonas rubra]